jgi:hypothetical protein
MYLFLRRLEQIKLFWTCHTQLFYVIDKKKLKMEPKFNMASIVKKKYFSSGCHVFIFWQIWNHFELVILNSFMLLPRPLLRVPWHYAWRQFLCFMSANGPCWKLLWIMPAGGPSRELLCNKRAGDPCRELLCITCIRKMSQEIWQNIIFSPKNKLSTKENVFI